jgi:hypothetical protein
MSERDLIPLLESSLLVRGLERAGQSVRRAVDSSVLAPAAARAWRGATSRIGMVLMIATITHVALTLGTRPAQWFWLMLPAVVAVIAGFLIVVHDRPRTAVD